MTGKNNIGNGLDQFYTNPKLAKCCYDAIKSKVAGFESYDLELEPSAGDGAFYKLMSPLKRYGIDLDPKYKGVVKQDFFSYHPKPNEKRVITIGNPPFGKNASLAIKFFNHAAEFSDTIAFIVPKSFKKVSVQNKLDFGFWLLYEKDCPAKSFVVGGIDYDVPCVFQIWVRRRGKRTKILFNPDNDVFKFVKKNDADIAIRRVGGTAGKSTINIDDAKETTHYYIKMKRKTISKIRMVNYINSLDFDSVRNSTAGPRSVSKHEFVEIFFKDGGIK